LVSAALYCHTAGSKCDVNKLFWKDDQAHRIVRPRSRFRFSLSLDSSLANLANKNKTNSLLGMEERMGWEDKERQLASQSRDGMVLETAFWLKLLFICMRSVLDLKHGIIFEDTISEVYVTIVYFDELAAHSSVIC
jgi:hypothetical protein